MKVCSKCGEEKSNEQFHSWGASKDGLYKWCKKCKHAYDAEYRKSEKVILHQASDKNKEHKRKYRDAHYMKIKLSTTRARVQKQFGEDYFSITEDDLVLPEFCPLLGTKMQYSTGSRINANGASIDRIDNSKGYIPGNVWVISSLANTMKSKATNNELVTFAENVLKHFKREE